MRFVALEEHFQHPELGLSQARSFAHRPGDLTDGPVRLEEHEPEVNARGGGLWYAVRGTLWHPRHTIDRRAQNSYE